MERLLLGRSCEEYGPGVLEILGESALALSAGARPSASSRFKRAPNEDALFYREEKGRCLLAVADSHWGCQSSHLLLSTLATQPEIPKNPKQLNELLMSLPDGEDTESATTLLVAVYDRHQGQGFGLSFGDSSLVILRNHLLAQWQNSFNPHFVSSAGSLDPSLAHSFEFQARSGQLLLLFTDGINECCYRRPECSIGPLHLRRLFGELGAQPEAYARALMKMALEGVDGNPGGEDNIALIVSPC